LKCGYTSGVGRSIARAIAVGNGLDALPRTAGACDLDAGSCDITSKNSVSVDTG
jgi:hypothetical protein